MIDNATMNGARRLAPRLALPVSLMLLALALGACSGGEVEAATRAEDLAEREAALAEVERQLAERDTELGEREGRLAERDKTLELRQQEIAARESALAGRDEQLAATEGDLAARRAAAEAAESRLAEERQALAAERDSLERRSAELAAEHDGLERHERELARNRPRAVWVEAELAAGTLFDVELLSTVSSGSSQVGERFRARLAGDLLTGDGTVAVPGGTELAGTVVEAVPLKKVGGQARLGLSFDQLLLPAGKTVDISASFYGENREGRRDAAKIGGAAAGGAILGRILDRDDKGRATILGAILGAAAGTAAAAGGDEVEIPAGFTVTLRLDQPATVMVPWRSRYDEGS